MKFYKMLFFNTLIMSTLISISSYSWFGMWMGMEINLLSIIPLMNSEKNSMTTESSLKYFITQAIASTMILFSIMLISMLIYFNSMNYLMNILNTALLTKMGAAPFHFWFPEVMEGLNWMNCLIMLTWQKITPMILIMYNINNSIFFSLIILMCLIISSIMSFNQISLRKILTYSSINHIGWMLSSLFLMETIWIYYFLIYSIISINIIIMLKIHNTFYYKQFFLLLNNNSLMKLFFSLNFLSLGGIPPFLGFLPKWLTIQNLINNNFYILSIFMILFTLIMLFIYLRLSFPSMILNIKEINYIKIQKTNFKWIFMSNFLMINSLILITLQFNFT